MALRVRSPRGQQFRFERQRLGGPRTRRAAPGAIATDFGQAVALLAAQPGLGARDEDSRTPGVRRLFLNRVGYFIYCKQQSGDLQVLAFWHSSREYQPRL
jgi:hypothetical protein